MPESSVPFVLRAIRLAYLAFGSTALICAFGGYYYWPGLLAWVCIALGLIALVAALALTQLLSRIRMILVLLPFLERLRKSLPARGATPQPRGGDREGS